MKKVFISSATRYDMNCGDKDYGENIRIIRLPDNSVTRQIKTAPENCDDAVLDLMGKVRAKLLKKFLKMFQKAGKRNRFLAYYFIAAYPGDAEKEMINLRDFIGKNLMINPQQVQIFTPTPSTNATMMHYTEKDLSGNKIFVEKDRNNKQRQKRKNCRN